MDTNRVPQPRHDDDSVEAHYACLERPTPAWTAGCSLAALSSPSTTLMARSSSTSACRAAVALAKLADRLTPGSVCRCNQRGHRRVEYSRRLDELQGE
jgi:hypothetical protein